MERLRYNGIFLDDVGRYFTNYFSGAGLLDEFEVAVINRAMLAQYASEMMAFVVRIGDEIREANSNAYLMINSGLDIVDHAFLTGTQLATNYYMAVDGFLMEAQYIESINGIGNNPWDRARDLYGRKATDLFALESAEKLSDVSEIYAWAYSEGILALAAPSISYSNAPAVPPGTPEPSNISGNDSIFGSYEADNIQGGAGNDTINGGNGNDLIFGGFGSDVIDGADGDDYVSGGTGNDVLNGGAGIDVIETGKGLDLIKSSRTDLDGDLIVDFDVDDMIILQSIGMDAAAVRVDQDFTVFEIDGDLDGHTDSSFALQGNFLAQSFEISSDGTNTIIQLAGETASLLSVSEDRFIATDNDANRVYGDLGNDVILSAGGADILSGGIGADVLHGGGGDDTLLGGLDNDQFTGGKGEDVFAFDVTDFRTGASTADFITDFTQGEDVIALTGFGLKGLNDLNFLTLGSGDAIDLGANRFIVLEGLSHSSLGAADVAFGDAGLSYGLISNNSLHRLTDSGDRFVTSYSGGNEVRSGRGNDVVICGEGEDVIYGEEGADVLLGGLDADIIVGGQGGDRMTGGEGTDDFVFTAGEETGLVADFITDFELGVDQVVLNGFGMDISELTFRTLGSGDIALNLTLSHFVVFEGYGSKAEMGDLEQVFEFT